MDIPVKPVPFNADDYLARMDGASYDAFDVGLAGVVVAPGPDLVWLTGYRPTAVTERLTMLLLVRGRRPVLVVPALERPDAEASPAAPGLRIVEWSDGADPYQVMAALLPASGVLAISDSAWSVHLLGLRTAQPALRYRGLGDALPMLRAVKDGNELGRLAAAAAAADEAYREIVRLPFAGLRERDVAASLAELLRAFGHEQVDFTIVGSGPNGANPHHAAGDRIIEHGDTVVLDFGGLVHGYGSDTTRTVHVGAPDPLVREVHEVVRVAQQEAFDAVRAGTTCQDIDRVARAVITDAGYGDRFPHRTGHGIGVTTHEPPYLVEGETLPLEPGMCFSIEPGVYLPGRFGVRIEDIVTVTSDGAERLNHTSRSLLVVD
ncbi:aminopeptidase P family protein [Kibdelosporangium lantanae]